MREFQPFLQLSGEPQVSSRQERICGWHICQRYVMCATHTYLISFFTTLSSAVLAFDRRFSSECFTQSIESLWNGDGKKWELADCSCVKSTIFFLQRPILTHRRAAELVRSGAKNWVGRAVVLNFLLEAVEVPHGVFDIRQESKGLLSPDISSIRHRYAMRQWNSQSLWKRSWLIGANPLSSGSPKLLPAARMGVALMADDDRLHIGRRKVCSSARGGCVSERLIYLPGVSISDWTSCCQWQTDRRPVRLGCGLAGTRRLS